MAAEESTRFQQTTILPRADSLPTPEIIVIRSKRQSDALLFEPGFKRLVGVSYVASLSLVEELFANGYEEIELVVGDDFGESYKRELKGKDIETVTRLAEFVSTGRLRLFFPKRMPDHSKLYILLKPGQTRIIFGAANLTESARRGRQANMMMVWDLPEGDPFIGNLFAKYETDTRKNCDLFMGDLVAELKERVDQNRPQSEIVEAWLNRNPEVEEDLETTAIFAEITTKALDPERNTVPIIVVDVPKSVKTEKKLLTAFSQLSPDRASDGIRLNGLELAKFVQERWHVPLMRLDLEKRVVRANVRGVVEELTAPLSNVADVNDALAHIEDYINTVELGTSQNPLLAKQSMFEALLYILASPFANERMKATRERHGAVTRRGPAVLYVTGPSSNGKTAFVKFALKLLTGYNVEPIDGQNHFTKTQVRAIRNLQTVFPMVFDDVPAARKLEGVVKPYWETEWRPDIVFPQLVITSNEESLEEWAKTRVKLIHFDVHFTESKVNKDRLASLLARETHFFRWFSYLYFQQLGGEAFLADDQLKLARVVLKQLYQHAGRPLPPFFLDVPLELIHDPGRSEWMRVIRLRKVTLDENANEAVIDFAADLEPREISRYEGHLPQEIKHKRAGKSLIVQNPASLFAWIPRNDWPRRESSTPSEPTRPSKRPFWARVLRRPPG